MQILTFYNFFISCNSLNVTLRITQHSIRQGNILFLFRHFKYYRSLLSFNFVKMLSLFWYYVLQLRKDFILLASGLTRTHEHFIVITPDYLFLKCILFKLFLGRELNLRFPQVVIAVYIRGILG